MEWSKALIAIIASINEEGITPAALADAKADAKRYPDLNRFLEAEADNGSDQD